MHENELRAHVAALLIAARHVAEAYGNASVREQKESIDRLRRVIKNVEQRVATSAATARPPREVGPHPEQERDLAKERARDDEEDRTRVAKSRARLR